MRVGMRPGMRPRMLPGLSPLWVPESSAEWQAALPAVTVPTALYLCQDASTAADDSVGANDLDQVNGTPDFRFDKRHGRWRIRMTSTERLQATSTTYMDADAATSVSLLMVACLPEALTSTRCLGGKRGATGGGWNIQATTAGAVQLSVYDGTSFEAPTVSSDHREVLTPMVGVIDRSANTATLETSLGSASADISAIGSAGNATAFGLGAMPFLAAEDTRYWYAAAWDGTALTATERSVLRDFFTP